MVRSGRRRVGYFGSKATAGLWQPLISMMPPHDVYIESHLGGGAIMQRKPPALRNIGIDPDARVIESFRCDYPVELVHGCAHRFLAGFPFRGRELVYADPPYLHEVRRGPRRYRYEYERSDHVALLDLLKGLPCRVMLSGYPRRSMTSAWPTGGRSRCRSTTRRAWSPSRSGSTSSPTGCIGRASPDAIARIANRSNARRPTGLAATPGCHAPSASPCWRRSWRSRPRGSSTHGHGEPDIAARRARRAEGA